MDKNTSIKIDEDPKPWGKISNYKISYYINEIEYLLPRETYSVGDFVSVLPVNFSDKYLYLIEQPRAGMLRKYGKLSIEVCGGKVENGDPLNSAINELKEECGIACDRKDISLIADLMVSPGALEEKTYLYLAQFEENQVFDSITLDVREPIIRKKFLFSEVSKLIKEGSIKDMRTLYLLKYLNERNIL